MISVYLQATRKTPAGPNFLSEYTPHVPVLSGMYVKSWSEDITTRYIKNNNLGVLPKMGGSFVCVGAVGCTNCWHNTTTAARILRRRIDSI
jgi:hypothetical protein